MSDAPRLSTGDVPGPPAPAGLPEPPRPESLESPPAPENRATPERMTEMFDRPPEELAAIAALAGAPDARALETLRQHRRHAASEDGNRTS